MPFNNEYANPLGYETIFEDNILDSLKSFSFTPPEGEAEFAHATELMEVKRVDDLPISIPLEAIDKAIAVDGSIARVDDELTYEIALLKIATIVADLKRIQESNKIVEATLLNEDRPLYDRYHGALMMGGRGIYGDINVGPFWQDKFRYDLNSGVKGFPVLDTSVKLNDFIEGLFEGGRKITCQYCDTFADDHAKKIHTNRTRVSCVECGRFYYPTDAIFSNWLCIKDNVGSTYLSLMVILEKILTLGMMETSLSLDKELYITDGPLVIYGPFAHLTKLFRERIQSLDTPLLIGVEKHGVHHNFAMRDDIQAALFPGSVALLSTELTERLCGKMNGLYQEQYGYGKRFLYRTLNGEKTFVFMAVPERNLPYVSKDDTDADNWDRYPHLRLYCEYLETHSIDTFGTTEAAIDILAEANHEASLPKTLSEKILKEKVAAAKNIDEDRF